MAITPIPSQAGQRHREARRRTMTPSTMSSQTATSTRSTQQLSAPTQLPGKTPTASSSKLTQTSPGAQHRPTTERHPRTRHPAADPSRRGHRHRDPSPATQTISRHTHRYTTSISTTNRPCLTPCRCSRVAAQLIQGRHLSILRIRADISSTAGRRRRQMCRATCQYMRSGGQTSKRQQPQTQPVHTA